MTVGNKAKVGDCKPRNEVEYISYILCLPVCNTNPITETELNRRIYIFYKTRSPEAGSPKVSISAITPALYSSALLSLANGFPLTVTSNLKKD